MTIEIKKTVNRPMKFRMWIPDNSPGGTMVFRGIYDQNWYLDPIECLLYREIRQRDHQFPLMQFTGFHSNNGQPIYEGDIVHYKEEGPSYFFEEPEFDVGIVHWDEEWGGFYVQWTTDDTIIGDTEITSVIGNIYEDPELNHRITHDS